MLHNLQQASVDPQLNDGGRGGGPGVRVEAAREPTSKRTKMLPAISWYVIHFHFLHFRYNCLYSPWVSM